MSDIVNELRERSLRAEQEGEQLALLDDAADEIKRLRLTDEEREAIERVAKLCDFMATAKTNELAGQDAATLRGLLERLGGAT